MMSEKDEGKPGSRKARLALACLFAAAGWAVCYWSYGHFRRVYSPPKTPVPVMEYIPVVPKERQAAVANAITMASKLALGLTAGQEDKMREIWGTPPRSLQELIGKTQRMDRIMTAEQLSRMRPMRRMVQNKIVDELFEPGRSRFTPRDFERMKSTIKVRVEQRMSAQ